MALEHKAAAITVWVICAVVLVLVISLAIFLFLYQRRRHALSRRRRRYLKSITFDYPTEASGDAWGTDGAGGSLHPRFHGGTGNTYYVGFQRITTEELEATPSPESASRFPAPLVVHLRARGGVGHMDECDILLTVDRLRDSVPSDRSSFRILGNDSYYHNGFLLYTAPLEFHEPGVYSIAAHTVHPAKEVVGAVHQLIYVVTGMYGLGDPTPSPSPADRPLLKYASGSAPGNHENLIDIDVARRQVERAQSNRNALLQTASPNQLGRMSGPSLAMVPSSIGITGDMPLPPDISPNEGEVTTSTEIVITPHRHSTSPDQLRYSVDGSYPTLVYTGPFKLSLPPPSVLPSQRREVIVQAISVHAPTVAPVEGSIAPSTYSQQRGGGVSSITRAVLRVQSAGHSFFDSQVPAPSARLRASDATLYFDESNNPPYAQTVYELVFVDEARRKVKFSRQRAKLYDGHPIALSENVATIHAWTVINPSAAAGRIGDDHLADAADRVRSVSTVYDCSRAATEHGKVSRQRIEQYNMRPEQLLPPPVICVSCSEMELAFDDPPANGRIAYTLNNTEPALLDVNPPACAVPFGGGAFNGVERQRLGGEDDDHASPIAGDETGAHTLMYKPGRYIHVTLMETQPVFVTARVFVPMFEGSDGTWYGGSGAQGNSCLGSGRLLGYRYGGVFHRGFHFSRR